MVSININLSESFRSIKRKTKAFLWGSKDLAYFFYKLKYTKKKSLVIVPHEGLGDFVAIYSGLKYLCLHHQVIYVATRKDYFDGLSNLTDFPKNLKLVRFYYKNKSYRIKKREKFLFKSKGQLIPLGHYDADPIYMYPDCFFTKMGVPRHLINEQFINKVNPEDFESQLKKPDQYIYINKKTALVDYGHNNINFDKKIIFTSPLKLIYQSNGEISEIYTPSDMSLAINHHLAFSAKEIFLSDAGFYNIFIRTPNYPRLTVTTRISNTPHNPILYRHPFDGKDHVLARDSI